jgi:hypothetical protein
MIKGKAFGSVKDCVQYINNKSIKKEQIINILSFEGMIFLIWSE